MKPRLWLTLWTVSSFGLLGLGVTDAYFNHALETRGAVANAIVTEMQPRLGRSSHPSIKYRLELKGSSYTHDDPFGRADLWSSISQKHWDEMRVGGLIQVSYLPARPSINRPTGSPSRWGDAAAAFVFGCVGVGLGCVLLAAHGTNLTRRHYGV
ncbi:DUF3592 domain-containing protein [Xenophilus sp. Marseille-Q4582]|uniref:DUF3592 domain-containing protein n=1 Tax=Xenophilus sp. Marseille-Q4582 TaxID=2866600 RepID=UPI001CE43D70